VVKRFKITGTGKVLFHGAGRRHLLQGKSPKRSAAIAKSGAPRPHRRIKQNLPSATEHHGVLRCYGMELPLRRVSQVSIRLYPPIETLYERLQFFEPLRY